ncbi:diadenylate cyclase CdaA [Candidatus Cyanaurora vandensis]|uniref:diadenylate cyclase CdaA n=1 Tax=Candidatus Cyanaurora vandensis TaxID=2714958 RepID=UPI00257A4785|nr:diadenylate cyclase CdaA [Candidatus Cyanaurora vandensis]
MDERAFKTWLLAFGPLDALDWFLVGLLLYWGFQLVRRTRAVWLIRGFLILVGAYFLSSLARLTLLNLILDKVLIGVAVAIPVLFQPELRKLLEQLGRGDFITNLLPTAQPNREGPLILALLEAVQELSEQRVGALIVLEGAILDERTLSDTGVLVNAELSCELLVSLFMPRTPLHDGAVVIREGRLWAAGVILPIANKVPSKQLGTRHRAAIGLTEVSDSHCIVVSEETGSIAWTEGGNIQRPLSLEELKARLLNTVPITPKPLPMPVWMKKVLFPATPE